MKVGDCGAFSGIPTLKLFVVRTDNHLLTYIMTTPNVDATQHHWVESLARFTFSIEYQKGWDNAAADALSWVTLKLDAETMKSILGGVNMGMPERADAHEPAVAEVDEEIHKQVWETAILVRAPHVCVNLHVTDWVATKQEDLILKTMIEWISNQKVQDLKHLLGDDTNTKEQKAILWQQKSWHSTKDPSTFAIHWLVNWKKFCSLWSPWLMELLSWMDVNKMLDIRVSSKL